MTTTEHTCCAVYWEKKDGHYDHIMEEFATEAEFCESTDATEHWCMFVNWKEYSVCQTGGIIVTVLCVAIAVRTGQQFLLLLLLDSPLFSLASVVIADSCGWRAPWQGETAPMRMSAAATAAAASIGDRSGDHSGPAAGRRGLGRAPGSISSEGEKTL